MSSQERRWSGNRISGPRSSLGFISDYVPRHSNSRSKVSEAEDPAIATAQGAHGERERKKGALPSGILEQCQAAGTGHDWRLLTRATSDSYLKRKIFSKLDENYNLDVQEASEH